MNHKKELLRGLWVTTPTPQSGNLGFGGPASPRANKGSWPVMFPSKRGLGFRVYRV